MPTWNNDPSSFGWEWAPTKDVVPFTFRGQTFPQGVHRLTVPLFTRALTALVDVGGLVLHPGLPSVSGDWGYEVRDVNGSPGTRSFHGYALALDINAPWNPQYANPPADSLYRMPTASDSILRPLGIAWGGGPSWGTRRDWMHIECHLSPGEIAAQGDGPGGVPFPLPAGYYFGPAGAGIRSISGYASTDKPYVSAIQRIQRALGVSTDGLYGPRTTAAAKLYQTGHSLTADGLVGPLTWRALFDA